MPSPALVEIVLDAADRLVEQAATMDPQVWAVLADTAQQGRCDRLAVAASAMVQAADVDRGPLIQAALNRLQAHADTHLQQLPARDLAIAVEVLMTALIACATNDLITSDDNDTLMAPLTQAIDKVRA